MGKALRIAPLSTAAIVAVILLAAFISLRSSEDASSAVQATLVAQSVAVAPTLDGNGGDAAWTSATALDVPVAGGWYGTGVMNVKAVYSGSNIYFKVVYADASRDSRREPWVKNGDGSWTHVDAMSEAWMAYNGTAFGWQNKDPNAAYEDKFAFMWNTTGASAVSGFNTSGCAVLCHYGTGQGGNGDFGRHYTNTATEKADFWHMKSVRMSPVYTETDDGAGGVYQTGQIHDQNVDNCIGTNNPYGLTEDGLPHTLPNGSVIFVDDACNTDWGRHGDPKATGASGYSNNQNVDNTLPSHTSATQPADGSVAHPYFLRKSEEVAFVDSYVTGDEIAGIRISPMDGDAGNISSGSHYDNVNHTWTVEFSRALDTGTTTDVQFTDMNQEYFFGTAIFDNAQVQHSTSDGVYRMVFSGGNVDDKNYYMPWFDNTSSRGINGDWVNIANMGTNTVTAEVNVGANHIGTVSIPAGGETNVTAPEGTDGGPVQVACSHCQTTGDILVVTQRTLFKNSFNEAGSLESEQLGSAYAFPWYDHNTAAGMLGDWIVVGNTSDTEATVDVFIGDLVTPIATLVIPAGGVQYYQAAPGLFAGPVKVAAQGTQKLIVSQRVIYLDSFNEILGTVLPVVI
jgi:hypothetical protein